MSTSRIAIWLAFVGLVCLPAVVLWPYRQAGFVSDDIFFAQNLTTDSWSNVLIGPWPHPLGVAKAWRPLVLVSYFATHAWSSGQPEDYRLFNYLVHGLNAALLAALVRRVTNRSSAGLLAGVLFAVHPMTHESVLWISGRTFPMAATCALALCLWTVGAPNRRVWLQHLVGVSLLAGALAAYEFSVVLPFVVILLGRTVWPASRTRTHALLLFGLPYFTTLTVYLLFRWLWLSGLTQDIIVVARASQWVPVGPITSRVPVNTFFFLLHLLAWPWFERASDITLNVTGTLTSVIALVCAAIVWTSGARRSVGFFWLAWIVLWFAPVAAASGFSDRFGYLGAAGLAAVMGTALACVVDGRRVIQVATFSAAMAVLIVLWTADLRSHGRDWARAGLLAQRAVDQVVQLEPFPDKPAVLQFIDVPRREHSALVFITYFPLAVLQRYPVAVWNNMTFRLHYEPAELVLPGIQAEAREAPTRVYQWDVPSQRFHLIWSGGENTSSRTSTTP